MKRLFLLLISVFLINGSHVTGQILDPAKWEFKSRHVEGNNFELVFEAIMENGWYVYSQYLEEGGPIPTSFTFEKNKDIKLLGKVAESGEKEKEGFDKLFEMSIKKFGKHVTFIQKIQLLGEEATVKGAIEYMTCDDNKCLPPKDVDFELTITSITGTQKSKGENEIKVITLQKEDQPEQKELGSDDVERIEEKKIIEKTAKVDNLASAKASNNQSLWIFFFIALSAGFMAVFTPCVYPMIPMTVTFFMQESEKKSQAISKAIIYGISIVVIYTTIGVVVSATLGPDFINYWLSTHWLPNILFFLLFTVFAASFFGMFEIVLPGWMVNMADKQADKRGLLSTFFMALTLVLISFSCTIPFIGGLLFEASQGIVIKPVIGMFGFSLAFAFPFTLLAFFPSWLNKLPKSGGWLNAVKVVLGFIILALGMKFLIIPDQTYHWNILDREVYLSIWIAIFTLMGFYLLGKIKLPHDSDLPHISIPRLGLALATFAFVVYLIPGMFGAPLKAISGLLPSPASHDFDLTAIKDTEHGTTASTENYANLCEQPKYADFLHFPHGLQGYFDYEQGLACAKKLNKPIFLDFNGHGCANCKDMEANVWPDPKVLKRLRNEFVLIALYVDDKTKLLKKEWITSTYDGKVKKTLGKKNVDFQITRYKNNSQPYYVILDHDGNSLTQPVGRVNTEQFIEFLDKGLEAFKK